MSIDSKIDEIESARNTIRSKMIAAGQASSSDKLADLADNLTFDKYYSTDDSTESTLANDDYVPFYDTSATAKKKSTWSNIKSKLKTYFDTLYPSKTTVPDPTSGDSGKFLRGDGSWQTVSSGGGHTIEDPESTALTQRDTLQFGGDLEVSDDDENEKTVVAPHELTAAELTEIMSTLPGSRVDVKVSRPVVSEMDRWLRFDKTNTKGLIIKGNTYIRNSVGSYVPFYSDTQIDLTSDISTAGADYFVNMADDGTITASTSKLSTGVTIGRFHTLCVAAGNNLTMKAPASPSSGIVVNDYYLVKSYSETADPDFYAFYNKLVTAVEVSRPYDVITCAHPLSGFAAGSILPESVFCLTFHPECLVEDAMVFDKDTGIAVDVYLQSGTGFNTRSKYNQTHTANRQQMNHQEDYRMVGKKLLRDSEFTSAAIGSNEGTVIKGAADANVVGGHVDTSGRRMISAIGCEEMVGYLWQWLDTLCGWKTSSWGTRDGKGTFGNEYGDCYAMRAGGAWDCASADVGSRCRSAIGVRSGVVASVGGRGSSRIARD